MVHAQEFVAPQISRRTLQDDGRDAVRLVGYLEYGRALRLFEKLAQTTSPNEWQAMDEVVQENPQYTIYVNLLSQNPEAEQSPFVGLSDDDDEFARRGLDWVLALARVEHGAIIAAYSDADDPFPQPAANATEADAFQELLLESALLHAWSMKQDLAPPEDAQGGTISPRPMTPRYLLALERRVSLTWKMLQAVDTSESSEMTQTQRDEFFRIERNVRQLRDEIRNDALRLGVRVKINVD